MTVRRIVLSAAVALGSLIAVPAVSSVAAPPAHASACFWYVDAKYHDRGGYHVVLRSNWGGRRIVGVGWIAYSAAWGGMFWEKCSGGGGSWDVPTAALSFTPVRPTPPVPITTRPPVVR